MLIIQFKSVVYPTPIGPKIVNTSPLSKDLLPAPYFLDKVDEITSVLTRCLRLKLRRIFL